MGESRNCILGELVCALVPRDAAVGRTGRSAGSRITSVSRIDRVSRVLFPLLFGCLTLFYWNLYWSQPPPNSWEMTD